MAKTIAKPDLHASAWSGLLPPNEPFDERRGNHARDALEYAASVVEFDAFDRVWKTSQPPRSDAVHAMALRNQAKAWSRRPGAGAVRLWLQGQGEPYFGVSQLLIPRVNTEHHRRRVRCSGSGLGRLQTARGNIFTIRRITVLIQASGGGSAAPPDTRLAPATASARGPPPPRRSRADPRLRIADLPRRRRGNHVSKPS